MATAFTNNPDTSDLLRFPLSYRAYFLVRFVYGSFDPATTLACMWLTGIFIGVTFARPLLFPWTMLILIWFAVFNLLLMQMIFAWIERWLAQRRTREIMGFLFVLLMLSFQFIGPVMQHFNDRPTPEARAWAEKLIVVQRTLPPGLTANAMAQAVQSNFVLALASFALLALFAVAVGSLLHLRLRAQFRGESLSEAGARDAAVKDRRLRLGWGIVGLSAPVAAVFEKEIRYLARSGPMLLSLIMPVFMLVVFRLGPLNPMRNAGAAFGRTHTFAFPAVAAYGMLVLTNLVYNSFGGDAGGVQFFYASPVSFRQILAAKNMTHAGILLFNMALAWLTVGYLYGPPRLDLTVATVAGLLFAAPLNFTAGNLLSIYAPKRRDFAAFGRQAASQMTVLVSLGLQVVIVGIGVGAFLLAHSYDSYWVAALIFLLLSVVSIGLYFVVLSRIDQIALERRETLMAELCRA